MAELEAADVESVGLRADVVTDVDTVTVELAGAEEPADEDDVAPAA